MSNIRKYLFGKYKIECMIKCNMLSMNIFPFHLMSFDEFKMLIKINKF